MPTSASATIQRRRVGRTGAALRPVKQLAGALADPVVIAASLRLTHGNLRLVVRRLDEVVRVLAVNQLERVTLDAIDMARATLVIDTA